MPQDRTGRDFPCTVMEKIGRHDIEADRANDVAPSREKQAPPSGGICFSLEALTNGPSAPADNQARKARASESYAMADNIVIWR